MFIWEWDKENVQAHFSDKDNSQMWNALSEDISNSKSKHRQDMPDLHYTKNHSLLNPDPTQPSWRTWPKEQLCCLSSLISCARTPQWFVTKSLVDRITVDSIITEWNSDILYAPALYSSRSVFQDTLGRISLVYQHSLNKALISAGQNYCNWWCCLCSHYLCKLW